VVDVQHTGVPTSVYRYFDVFGILIYVGITAQRMARNSQHNLDKTWWGFVARQEVEHFSSRPDAHRREIELIQEFRPPFNTQHNPMAQEMRAIYLAFRASEPAGAEEVYESTNGLIPATPCLRGRAGTPMLRTNAEHAGLALCLTFHKATLDLVGGLKVGQLLGISSEGPFALLSVAVRRGVELEGSMLKVNRVGKTEYQVTKIQVPPPPPDDLEALFGNKFNAARKLGRVRAAYAQAGLSIK
jgi:hypothetical protein